MGWKTGDLEVSFMEGVNPNGGGNYFTLTGTRAPSTANSNRVYVWTDLVLNNAGEKLVVSDFATPGDEARLERAKTVSVQAPNNRSETTAVSVKFTDLPVEMFWNKDYADQELEEGDVGYIPEFASEIYVAVLASNTGTVPVGDRWDGIGTRPENKWASNTGDNAFALREGLFVKPAAHTEECLVEANCGDSECEVCGLTRCGGGDMCDCDDCAICDLLEAQELLTALKATKTTARTTATTNKTAKEAALAALEALENCEDTDCDDCIVCLEAKIIEIWEALDCSELDGGSGCGDCVACLEADATVLAGIRLALGAAPIKAALQAIAVALTDVGTSDVEDDMNAEAAKVTTIVGLIDAEAAKIGPVETAIASEITALAAFDGLDDCDGGECGDCVECLLEEIERIEGLLEGCEDDDCDDCVNCLEVAITALTATIATLTGEIAAIDDCEGDCGDDCLACIVDALGGCGDCLDCTTCPDPIEVCDGSCGVTIGLYGATLHIKGYVSGICPDCGEDIDDCICAVLVIDKIEDYLDEDGKLDLAALKDEFGVDSVVLSEDALKAAAGAGNDITVILECGAEYTIVAETIDVAKLNKDGFDIEMAITANKATWVIDKDSIVITPKQGGEFGFDVEFFFAADLFGDVDLADLKLFYCTVEGAVKEIKDAVVIVYDCECDCEECDEDECECDCADCDELGVSVKFDNASFYVVSGKTPATDASFTTPATTTTTPNTNTTTPTATTVSTTTTTSITTTDTTTPTNTTTTTTGTTTTSTVTSTTTPTDTTPTDTTTATDTSVTTTTIKVEECEGCDGVDCEDCNVRADVNGDEKLTINDALEILIFLAKLETNILVGPNAVDGALNASLILATSQEAGEPTIMDVLEILKWLAKLYDSTVLTEIWGDGTE